MIVLKSGCLGRGWCNFHFVTFTHFVFNIEYLLNELQNNKYSSSLKRDRNREREREREREIEIEIEIEREIKKENACVYVCLFTYFVKIEEWLNTTKE
jgi:hypothetical protein